MKWLFDVVSRRLEQTEGSPTPVTPEFRNRVLLLCRDTFSQAQSGNYLNEFWEEIHQKLQYLHGSPILKPDSAPRNEAEDATAFLLKCESNHFLDFVEYLFQVDTFWRVSHQSDTIVSSINSFFQLDDLPYFLTGYVEVQEQQPSGAYRGGVVRRVSAYPKVILREQQFVHEQVTKQALDLLTDARFSSANTEFLEALEDYRKGDLGDCLTKCGSAFESVLKIICDEKGWPYQHSDTAARLLQTVLSRTQLDPFFEQPLILIATIRNRLSKSHGAGVQTKDVSPQVARFALNATAASILLLVEEAL